MIGLGKSWAVDAISSGGKAFYIQARAGCARRLSAAEELAEE